jgi:hypothetical protein
MTYYLFLCCIPFTFRYLLSSANISTSGIFCKDTALALEKIKFYILMISHTDALRFAYEMYSRKRNILQPFPSSRYVDIFNVNRILLFADNARQVLQLQESICCHSCPLNNRYISIQPFFGPRAV